MSILMGVLVVILLIACFFTSVREIENNETFYSLFAIVCLSIVIIMLTDAVDKNAYKRGQIDAIQGDIKYEMKVTPDTTWVELE